MANIINLLTRLKVAQGATIRFDNGSVFTSNPSSGQICFKEQILYIYATINNVSTWFPLTTVRDKYVHSQGGMASTWTITHNFGITDVIFVAYDSEGTVLIVNPTNITANSFELVFQEAEIGKVITFASREAQTIFKIGEMFEKTETGNNIIIDGNLISNNDSVWNIGSYDSKWKDMHLTGSTLLIGDSVTLSETGLTVEPPVSSTLLSQQPYMSMSKLYAKDFSYDGMTVNPIILSNADLTIGDGTQQVNVDVSNIIINSDVFGIDIDGNLSFTGSLIMNAIIDGGTWS